MLPALSQAGILVDDLMTPKRAPDKQETAMNLRDALTEPGSRRLAGGTIGTGPLAAMEGPIVDAIEACAPAYAEA
jgi:hypothetical protein